MERVLRMDFSSFLVYCLALYLIVRVALRLFRGFFATRKDKVASAGDLLPATRVVEESVGRVTELYVYPVKSCNGIKTESALIGEYGFQLDRMFVLARDEPQDDPLNFVTLRNVASLCHVAVEVSGDKIVVSFKQGDFEKLELPAEPSASKDSDAVNVRVWDDVVSCIPVGKFADDWFSAATGVKLRLFRIGSQYKRPLPSGLIPSAGATETSLADGFPFLLTTKASLEAVNKVSKEHIEMSRFRPNIVIESKDKAFAEDDYAEIVVGNSTFYNVKVCGRCKIPRMSLLDGKESVNQEPTTALQQLGHVNKEDYYFGINLTHHSKVRGNRIQVGDEVRVIKVYKTPLQKMNSNSK